MKRYLLAAFVVLTMAPGLAAAQMMGGATGAGGAPAMPPGQHEMKPAATEPGMGAGMMGQGMMSGMMSQGKEMPGGCMMSGGMMGPEMMGTMMPSMMDGMMSGKTRGCMMMADGMMKGQIDLGRMRKALSLSDEQVERLRVALRPFQKETILTHAAMKVAELELADLVAGEKVDFGKVEAKLKEIEGTRTKARIAHLKATAAVKVILGKEQLDKLQGLSEAPPPAPSAPQKGAAPQGEPGHEQHH